MKEIGKLYNINSLINKNTQNIAYLPVELVFLTLPYKKVETNEYVRYNKTRDTGLIIPKIGDNIIPYGIVPRAILYFLCTEVKKTKKKEIELGKTFNEVFTKLKLIDKNSSISGKMFNDFKTQLKALLESRIVIYEKYKKGKSKKIHEMQYYLDFTKKIEFWQKDDIDNYKITLTDDFYNSLVSSSMIPFEYDVLPKLRKSTMLLDSYIFLNTEAYYSKKFDKDIFISFDTLFECLGTTYGSKKKFKEYFIKKALPKIEELNKNIFIEKNMEKGNGGFTFTGLTIKRNSKSNIVDSKQLKLF